MAAKGGEQRWRFTHTITFEHANNAVIDSFHDQQRVNSVFFSFVPIQVKRASEIFVVHFNGTFVLYNFAERCFTIVVSYTGNSE